MGVGVMGVVVMGVGVMGVVVMGGGGGGDMANFSHLSSSSPASRQNKFRKTTPFSAPFPATSWCAVYNLYIDVVKN